MITKLAYLFSLSILLFLNPAYSQISGIVTDKETDELLSNIPIAIQEANKESFVIYSDSLGAFHCELNEVGNYSVIISALGYQATRIDNIFSNSKQIKHLKIELIPKQYSIDEIEVTHSAWGIDKSQGVSTYELSPHLMNLTVGSSYDILRTATLIPGVSNTSDASSDLNIRGNSPFGMQWYIEDVPVVSPNHFSDNNSSNGVFSIFDSFGVNKSTLFMSAFPVEYGNAISGVLNTELRTGNLQQLQGNINFSTVSAGAVLESPIKKGKSSVIGGFRYTFPNSIHKIFPSYSEKLGTVPDIFDGFFKFHSSITPKLKLSFWSIGGNSNASFRYAGESSEQIRLQRKGNSLSSGLSLGYTKRSLSFKSNIYTSHRGSYEYVAIRHAAKASNGWTGANSILTIHNPNSKVLLGVNFKRQYYNQYREIKGFNKDSIHTSYFNDFSAFSSYTHYFTHNFTLVAGLHYLYNGVAEEHRLEPRIQLKKQVASLGSIALGYGEHSVNSPIAYVFSYEQELNEEGESVINRNKVLIPLMKSRHFVLAWSKKSKSGIKLGSELFYQYLFDTSNKILSRGYTHNPYSYGGITLGAPSTPPTVFAVGRNYGVEFSMDAPISNRNMYFYLAGTLYNSEYKYGNGEWTPTLFNSTFSFSSAFRKEFLLGEKTKLATGLNYTAQGGRRYTPIDEELSEKYQQTWRDESRVNACKYPHYGRLDASLTSIVSSKKLLHSFSIEVQNVLNRKNILERYEYYQRDPVVINQVMRVFVYKYALSF